MDSVFCFRNGRAGRTRHREPAGTAPYSQWAGLGCSDALAVVGLAQRKGEGEIARAGASPEKRAERTQPRRRDSEEEEKKKSAEVEKRGQMRLSSGSCSTRVDSLLHASNEMYVLQGAERERERDVCVQTDTSMCRRQGIGRMERGVKRARGGGHKTSGCGPQVGGQRDESMFRARFDRERGGR